MYEHGLFFLSFGEQDSRGVRWKTWNWSETNHQSWQHTGDVILYLHFAEIPRISVLAAEQRRTQAARSRSGSHVRRQHMSKTEQYKPADADSRADISANQYLTRSGFARKKNLSLLHLLIRRVAVALEQVLCLLQYWDLALFPRAGKKKNLKIQIMKARRYLQWVHAPASDFVIKRYCLIAHPRCFELSSLRTASVVDATCLCSGRVPAACLVLPTTMTKTIHGRLWDPTSTWVELVF